MTKNNEKEQQDGKPQKDNATAKSCQRVKKKTTRKKMQYNQRF